ncbi:MAG: hypothetical protein M1554_03425 [Patescibacteria group bacterium]|jgi:hypothetical protein|nr:hypothetical protein [Patescibacteria group bacterium]
MHNNYILHLGHLSVWLTFFVIWLPLIGLFFLALAAFQIWMFVDVAINKKISDKTKTWWIIGMFLVYPIVAIVYFFTDHQKH